MSEHDNELKKALAGNGDFDAEKASRDVAQASRLFDSRLKRAARITWLRQAIVIGVFEFAFISFFFCYRREGYDRLWRHDGNHPYLGGSDFDPVRITNTKISLLREIKLLRLEHLERPTEQVASPAEEVSSTGALTRHTLSLLENMAWLLALTLVAGASVFLQRSGT